MSPADKRVKVFQVLECGGPGGTGNQVAALCNALDPARFEVGLIFSARGTDPDAYRAKASGAKTAVFVPELTREISPAKDWAAYRRLTRLFAEHKPDVVHAHSSKAGVLARLAARSAGVPKIFYSPHGYGFLQKDRGALSRGLYRLIERNVSGIGEIVAVSPSEGELARGLSRKPVHVVCDPYLGEEAPAPKPHEGLVVGSCGRLTAARNPDAWINLAQRLTDSRNGLRCVWVGGGELEADVRRHLENMNLGAKVEVTGWLEPEQARERLRGLDVFVHYSAWDALPNAVLEAMACGLPVVASDVPGCRDAIQDGATGLIAASEIDLLEKTLRLVDDAALRRNFGEAGRARVRETFSRRAAVAALERLYRL